jgi:hypothetical protein
MGTVYVQAGEEKVVDIIDGSAAPPVDLGPGNSFIGWGTGAGVTAKGDTTLFTEAAEARIAAAVSQPAVDVNQWLSELQSLSAQTITNAGIFDLVAAGILIVKGDFVGIVLGIGDRIEFTITLEQT